ncbi:MAG: hypothetical protein H6831_08355 [Planctomycetes bacterium]|nr:hypothetical protein [Planctomycetota bacterium]MCB9904404.1 hypothetical protein [Planctomycetota bacterium]
MLRKILGFVAAFVVVNVVVIVGFLGGAIVLGSERVLEPGGYDASLLWLFVSSLIGLVGASCGGVACQAISRDRRVAGVLAAVMFLFGAAAFFAGAGAPEPPPRPEGETGFAAIKAAAEHGREPLSTRVLNPLLAVAGVLAGASIVARQQGARRD